MNNLFSLNKNSNTIDGAGDEFVYEVTMSRGLKHFAVSSMDFGQFLDTLAHVPYIVFRSGVAVRTSDISQIVQIERSPSPTSVA